MQPLHVQGAQLVDEHNQPVQLRGVSTHGLSWYPQYVNATLFKNLKNNWGINVVRLAMYTAESGGYTTDGNKDELTSLIAQGVQAAIDNDMYVIIDWHTLSDNDPNMHIKEAQSFFDAMSKKYANVPNVIFEICNEPNGNTTWSQVKTYAQTIIPTIRKNSKDSIILVGTPTWCQDIDKVAQDPITGQNNIMYTLHFYAATHQGELRERMVKAVESGVPVFVSEFGITDASGSGAVDTASADAWVKAMDEHHISYIIWNLSNKNESSALFITAETNDPHDEDLSAEGRWFKQMLTGKPVAQPQVEQGLIWRIEPAESWVTDGRPYQKFTITVTNNTGKDLHDWSVNIPFNTPITLSDQWNANFSVNHDTLTVSSGQKNSTLVNGQSSADVGCIVIGNQAPQPLSWQGK